MLTALKRFLTTATVVVVSLYNLPIYFAESLVFFFILLSPENQLTGQLHVLVCLLNPI